MRFLLYNAFFFLLHLCFVCEVAQSSTSLCFDDVTTVKAKADSGGKNTVFNEILQDTIGSERNKSKEVDDV